MFRKTLVTIGFAGLSLFSFAQNKYGFFGGVQTTTARYLVKDNSQSVSNKFGAQLGATMKIPFENQLFFTPAVYYSMKGYKVELQDRTYPPGEDAISNDVTVHAIELAPLFNIDLSRNAGHLFIKFGPSIDVAIMGKETIVLDDRSTVKQDMKFSFEDYGRITSSAIVHLGYEMPNGVFVFGQYTHGLGSMNNADFGPIIRHRLFGISVGKYFGKNPNIIDTRNRQ